jgi:polar amino acid transport system substrate-binding protein
MNTTNGMTRLAGMAMLAALVFVGAGASANADVLDDIKAAKKIRIAIDLGLPPYGMTDDKMQPTGSDVETGRLLAKDLGVEFEMVPTTGASRIPSLQTGKADVVISTLSVTPERAKAIDFSVAYASLRTVVAGMKGIQVKSVADLDGKTIGTVRGTTHDTYLTQNAKTAKIVRYEDDATEAQAFVSGQVDLISTAELLLAPIGKRNADRQPELKFVIDTFKLAIGVKQGEPRLLQTVSDWVKTNLKNGKLNDIYKKYHGNDLPDVILKDGA